MSVVAVKIYNDKIKVAADSIVCCGSSKKTDGNFAKLVKVNDMIIGTVGNADEGSLMWLYAETHKPFSATEKDVLSFIAEFSKWKAAFGASGDIENAYIIVFNKKAFYISGLLVYRIKNYEAIGAGMDFANAALYLGHSPKKAVEVSCALSYYVAEPIIEYEVKFDNKKQGVV